MVGPSGGDINEQALADSNRISASSMNLRFNLGMLWSGTAVCLENPWLLRDSPEKATERLLWLNCNEDLLSAYYCSSSSFGESKKAASISKGTGKIVVVLFSTPISNKVCK